MRAGGLLAACAALAAPMANAQQHDSRAHMEACVRWSLAGSVYSTRNSCDTSVNIKFMTLDNGRTYESDVRPGAVFTTGPLENGGSGTMMFTVCPVGYVPSVRFDAEHAEPIIVSLYNCLPRNRPDS